MHRYSLLTEASIEAWIADNQPGGEDKLAIHLIRGTFGGERAAAILAYLSSDTDRLRAVRKAIDLSLAERRPLGSRALRASVTRWVGLIGPLALALILIAIILMPFWIA